METIKKSRGRPPKNPTLDIEIDEVVTIAEILHDWCSVSGCSVNFHKETAIEIIELLSKRGFKITKEGM